MSQPIDQQYKRLFKSSPGKVLVLRPGSFEIVAATDEYLRATLTKENDILGKTLFEVFPEDPEDPQADGASILSASLARVQSLKAPDVMGVQRYPVRLPDGTFEERFWSPVNSPILDEAGDVEFIMHRVEDLTAIINEGILPKPPSAIGNNDLRVFQDTLLRSKELRQALSRLQEYEARMLAAERLLNLGAWEFNIKTGRHSWSEQIFNIFDLPADQAGPDLEAYFATVHPDDRQATREIFATLGELNTSQVEFEHRINLRGGGVRYVKGVGERHVTADFEVVVVYFQEITPLIKTRRSLAQAENLLRLAGEKVRLGGWRVELNDETIIWTPETAAIHGMPAGYSPPSAVEAINFYAPAHRDLIANSLKQCVEEGQAFDVVCQLRRVDGQQPWVRVIGVAERNHKGSIVAVQGAFQDITTQHEAQLLAAEAERKRRDVLESISDGFYALDKNHIITYINRQAGVILERDRDEMLGKYLWDLYPHAVGGEFYHQFYWVLEHKQTVRFQAIYRTLGKWLDVTVYPIPDGLAVYFRDLSSEREHQEQLRLIEAALARQNDIVMITTADALDEPDGPRIVYVNEAFERITGYSKSEAIGRTPRMLHGPKSDRGQLDRIRNALQNRQPIRCEVLNYTKAGTPYWLELDITPLFDNEGLCTHFVAVERDITERIAMEQQLRESQKLETVGHLTGGVAHDFNNLLTVILGNAEMLVEGMTDPQLRSMAEMTLSAAERGAELTSRLLAFARRQPLNPEFTIINQLVEAMRPLIRRTLPEHIEIDFALEPNLSIIEIDAGELDTALLNLVVNARDAMQDGGKLTIETTNVVLDENYANRHDEVVAGEYVMLCVSDTGTGMTPETARQAFEPFFTTKLKDQGSGLGLSMVYGFTKQSKGHIKIYSELGEGSSIKLYFPKAQGAHTASDKSKFILEPVGGNEHILIAEDDDLVLQHLETQLRALGYRVTAVRSGPEALEALAVQPDTNMLLTDIIMPGGMNGRQLADQTRELYPAVKVLFTSGYTENAIVHHGRLDPGVELLSKPYTRLELATKVRRVLNSAD
ncbi:PAS domain S-box protein [Halopseudomonas sp.]|uniref:PAS domain S-box protein n=1 Tax=Halopseudomonas sp. TaxID=2901191 RepID=UPI003564EFBB